MLRWILLITFFICGFVFPGAAWWNSLSNESTQFNSDKETPWYVPGSQRDHEEPHYADVTIESYYEYENPEHKFAQTLAESYPPPKAPEETPPQLPPPPDEKTDISLPTENVAGEHTEKSIAVKPVHYQPVEMAEPSRDQKKDESPLTLPTIPETNSKQPPITLQDPADSLSPGVPSANDAELPRPKPTTTIKEKSAPQLNKKEPFQETPWQAPPPKKGREEIAVPPSAIETYYEPVMDKETEEELKKEVEEAKKAVLQANTKPPYRLKIGDQLSISLYGFAEGNTNRRVFVDPTGSITYLFVNRVYVLGKTIDQVRKELDEKIKPIYPNSIVTLSATELIGNQYTIMGEVNAPGTKPIRGNITLLSSIADAGGFPVRAFRNHTIDYADLDKAFLSRKGEYVPVDFEKLIRKGDLSQDVPLQGGDYVFIPSALIKEIYVLGEFNRPFVYTFFKTATLTEVITWAGGVTPRASSRVLVLRGSLGCPKSFLIDINRIFKGCAGDFVLEPGDIVFAPVQQFYTFKELIKTAVRTFVGAIALQAGNVAYAKINPKSIGIIPDNNNVLINPGTIPAAPAPQPPIILVP